MEMTELFDSPESTSYTQSERIGKAADILFASLIVLFLFSSNGIQKFPILLWVNKLSGVLLILTSLIYTRSFYVASVLKIFFAFIIVSFFTSFFVAINADRVTDASFRLFQLLVLLVSISQFYILRGNVVYMLGAIVLNCVLLIMAGKFLDPEVLHQGNQIERFTSINENPNGLAFQLLVGFISVLFFFNRTNIIGKGVVASLSILFFYNIAISGSRKAMIAYVLIFFFFLFFSFPAKKKIFYFFVVGLIGLFAGSYLFSLVSDTAVVQRFYKLSDNAGAADIRTQLYKEAFNAFADNPLFGIGLDNFRLYSSSGLYAHSNYMELLADTGLIGFSIYYLMYLKVWLGGSKIRRLEGRSEQSLFLSGLFKCVIILFLIIGAGSVQYDNFTHWILLLFPVIMIEQSVLNAEEQDSEDLNLSQNQLDLHI
ncbi:MAG TPA: O-antigen ligase family protein [Flavitalea sp.]|nr:O-antigen ligase family protein [Flavitalea sp.]